MRTVYLETTVVSYLTSRSSRDIIVLAHQEMTQTWWKQRRSHFNIFVSPVVIDECSAGDPDAARRRLAAIAGLRVLAATPEVERLLAIYHRELPLPERAIRDAAHLAFAAHYQVDYLLTWNCAHIANAETRPILASLNQRLGVATPNICTPEEFMGYGKD